MPEMVPNYNFWAGMPSLVKVKYQLRTNDFLNKQSDPKQLVTDSASLEINQTERIKHIAHTAIFIIISFTLWSSFYIL